MLFRIATFKYDLIFSCKDYMKALAWEVVSKLLDSRGLLRLHQNDMLLYKAVVSQTTSSVCVMS